MTTEFLLSLPQGHALGLFCEHRCACGVPLFSVLLDDERNSRCLRQRRSIRGHRDGVSLRTRAEKPTLAINDGAPSKPR